MERNDGDSTQGLTLDELTAILGDLDSSRFDQATDALQFQSDLQNAQRGGQQASLDRSLEDAIPAINANFAQRGLGNSGLVTAARRETFADYAEAVAGLNQGAASQNFQLQQQFADLQRQQYSSVIQQYIQSGFNPLVLQLAGITAPGGQAGSGAADGRN